MNQGVSMTSAARPVSGRLARPSWRDPRLLVGLVLIAASVAGVVSLVRAGDRTEPFYAARADLPPGTALSPQDVVLVQVRVDQSEYVGAAQEISGAVLTRQVGEGELLPASALASEEDYSARPIAVTTTRPVSEGIARGSLVDVWLTVVDDAGQPSSTAIATAVAVDEVVTDDRAFAGAGAEIVYVNVPQDQLAAFLDALALDGEVSVVGVAG